MPNKLTTELETFFGTGAWHQFPGQSYSLLTDGTYHLVMKARCGWLIKLIDYYLQQYNGNFLCSNLYVEDDKTADLRCHDGNYNFKFTHKLDYTDFPLEAIEIWSQWSPSLQRWVHMLPKEY